MGWPCEEDYLTRQILGEKESLTPLGSMFENNCTIFLDGLIVELMCRLKKTEEELKAKYAKIE
jgi:6-phospho-3-hexuloisomerase